MPQSAFATDSIYPMRFVKHSTVNGKVSACGAGEQPCGISQKGARRIDYIDSSGYAANAGEPLHYFDQGDIGQECGLVLGGTVAKGDFLKSGAAGVGVASTGDQDNIGAIAQSSGVSGEVIKVKPHFIERSTA